MFDMLEIATKLLQFELELKKKIEFICDFCNTTPEFKNGSIRNVDLTNISYIEPHRIIIKALIYWQMELILNHT